jgi:hypothetical protein
MSSKMQRPTLACLGFLPVAITIGSAHGQCFSFDAHESIWWQGPSSAIGAGDLSRDGNADLLCGMGNPSQFFNPSLTSLLADRTGGFLPFEQHSAAGPIAAIVVADFDSDGRLDAAYTGRDERSTIAVLRGNIDGRLAETVRLGIANTATTMTAGDFNADGRNDLAYGAMARVGSDVVPAVVTRTSQSNWTFGGEATTPVQAMPTGLSAADFNGDGFVDLALTSLADLLLLRGAGNSSFIPDDPLPLTSPLYAIANGDFNGDNMLDLAVSDGGSVKVLAGDGHGRFTASFSYPTRTAVVAIASADFDNDGRPDLAFKDLNSTRQISVLIILRNTGSIAVETQPRPTSACMMTTASMTVVGMGASPFQYQWRKNGVEINSLDNPTASSPDFILESVSAADAGRYDCVISNPCGSVLSASADLSICPADFNCDGGVDGGDVNDFFGQWESGGQPADMNEDGGVDGQDVWAFFEHWENGC